MEFQYDPKQRRHVEAWNIICFDGEDRIGLTGEEYNAVALDFVNNGMIREAKRAYLRGIDLGNA